MGAETHLTVADRRWLSPLALWSGIFAGPFAWAFDLEASYALVHWACGTQRVLVLHAITLFALLVTLGGLAVSWIALRHADDLARPRFMAILGIGSSLLFALAIIAGAIPRWVLDACQ